MSTFYAYTLGGSIKADNQLYIKRQADDEFLKHLHNGEFCYVLNARQMGKSSLRVRTAEALKQEGVVCVNIDITEIWSAQITPAQWYAGIIDVICREANLTAFNLDAWWQQHRLLSDAQHLSKFVNDVLLARVSQPIVIFVDETDLLQKVDDEFLALIRAFHEQRADKPAYQRLTFGILGVASPNDLIKDKTKTPFNIGQAIDLTGFDLKEALPLAEGLQGRAARPAEMLAEVLAWTGGQPFLTQKLCSLLSQQEAMVPAGEEAAMVERVVQSCFIDHWESQDEPVHLRHIRDRILRGGAQTTGRLLDVYQRLLRQGSVPADDSSEQLELRLAGLVVKRQNRLEVYNRIYAKVFDVVWVDNTLKSLRPYAEALTGWQTAALGKKESYLLRGEALQKAQTWAERKNLSEEDHQFLNASLKLEMTTQMQAALLQLQQERTAELFDSHLVHASLLARFEDYAQARQILDKTFSLDAEIPAPRRHARNLLAGFTDLRGGAASQVYRGAGAALVSVALSPDGKFLATAGERGTLVVFEVASGQLVKRLEGHDKTVSQAGAVFAVVFHPQGQWLASAGDDKRIIRWSWPSGEKLSEWQAPAVVNALALSPDGTLLASGGDDKAITLWTLTGETVRTFTGHEERISVGGLAFSPTGEWLASASYDKTARVWEVKTGKSLQVLSGHRDKVTKVAFSPDSTRLATSSADNTIILWQVASGEPLRPLRGHQNMVFGLQFMAAGRYVVSASFDRTLRVWDTESGVTVRVLQGHESGVGVGGIVSYEGQLFSASNDGTVRRWEGAVAQSGQGLNLTGLEDLSGLVKVITPHQQLVDLPSAPISVAISPEGHSVAVGFADGALRLYAWPEIRLLWEQKEAHSDQILRLAFNSGGTLLASSSHDNTAKLWQVDADQLQALQTFTGHTDSVHAVAFAPDSRTVATASYDGRIGLWTVGKAEKRFIERAHEGRVMSVAFDSSGTRLLSSGSDDHAMRLWNLNTTPPTLLQPFPQAQDMLLWASLSPDNQWVAGVGRDGLVHIYATASGQEVHRLVGHEQTIFRAIFSPDSTQVTTVSADATVRLWDVSQGRELFSLPLPTNKSPPIPLWDFDFRCLPAGRCWIAVPLTRGKLAVYEVGEY